MNFAGAKLEGLFLNTELSGPIDGLKGYGVEVAPLIEAEMVRRHPELAKLSSKHFDEMREGLQILEQQLSDTWSRAVVLSTTSGRSSRP